MTFDAILQKIVSLWEVYQPLLPYLGVAFILALILTPALGRLATKIGAMDLPAHLRKRTDQGLERNINSNIHPKLGGLAMAIAIVTTFLIYSLVTTQSWGIFVGILIIVIYGLLDDVKDLPFKYQLLGQFLAALVVVVSGHTIEVIQVAGLTFDFNLFSETINLGSLVYNFIFPADLVTILWIMAMINFVNWMSGMDGLNQSVTAIASVALLLIAVEQDLFVAALITIHLAANVGSGLFNYPPSYIFPGAIGEHLNGFLLATFAVLAGAKLPLAIIALGVPLIDALWVMGSRVWKSRKEGLGLKATLLSLTKADTNHLHHRLMALGFTWKAVLFAEVGITIALSALGFYLSGFRDEFVAMVASLSALIMIIGIISAISRRREKSQALIQKARPEPVPEAKIEVVYKQSEPEPEEKYVY